MSWLDRTTISLLDPADVNLHDSTYEVPYFGDSSSLGKSVAMVGVVNAPVLQDHSSRGLIPVLGRRRLRAARAAGFHEIPVRLIPPEMPEADGYSLAFWDNCVRITDPATTAHVVKRLLELFPLEEVCSTFLPVLNVPAKGPRLERLRRVGGLERTILEALALGRLMEKTAVTLAALDEQGRLLVFDLSQRLRLNANTCEEVVASLYDLAVVRGRSIGEIVASDPIASVLLQEDRSVPERAMSLRTILRSMKFPEVVAREREFREWCTELALPDNQKIRHASAFETDECTLEIKVDDREQAHQIVEALRAVDRD